MIKCVPHNIIIIDYVVGLYINIISIFYYVNMRYSVMQVKPMNEGVPMNHGIYVGHVSYNVIISHNYSQHINNYGLG